MLCYHIQRETTGLGTFNVPFEKFFTTKTVV